MKIWLKRQLTRLGYNYLRSQPAWAHPSSPEILHARVLPYCSYAPWANDARFLQAYDMVKNHTLVDRYRLHELWSLAAQLEQVDGDFLEVGVWRGGSGCLLAMADLRQHRKVFLADTFSGVVKASAQDTYYRGGEHADTRLDLVQALTRRCKVEDKIQILVGMFPELNAEQVGRKLAFVHIDVDVFESARDVLHWAIPKITKGGVVVFDDYGFYGCEGVTRMVNEFVKANHNFRFLHNLNGHAVLIKVDESVK